jgi:hypothetical protein
VGAAAVRPSYPHCVVAVLLTAIWAIGRVTGISGTQCGFQLVDWENNMAPRERRDMPWIIAAILI